MGGGQAQANANADRKRSNDLIDQYVNLGKGEFGAGQAKMDSVWGQTQGLLNNQSMNLGYGTPAASQSLGFLQNFINGGGEVSGARGMQGVMSGLQNLSNGTQSGNGMMDSAFRGQDTQSSYGGMMGQLMNALANPSQNPGGAQMQTDRAMADTALGFGVGQQGLQAQLASRGFGANSGIGAQSLLQNSFGAQKAVADARAGTAMQVAQLNQQGQGIAGQLYQGLRGQDQQFALGLGNLNLGALQGMGGLQMGINQMDQGSLTNRANMANQLLTTDLNRQQVNNSYTGQLLSMLAGIGGQQYGAGVSMMNPAPAQQQYQISNQNAQAAAQGQGQFLGSLLNFGTSLLTAPMTGGLSLLGRWMG